MIHPLPPCPSKEDVVRRYEVVAIQKKLIYNRYGDHDPNGLVFVPRGDLDNVLAGKSMPKPLILRANVGDWIEVTLHNAWDPEHPIPYFSYPRVPLDKEYTPSMRVSLNPQFLQYDPVSDSGNAYENVRREKEDRMQGKPGCKGNRMGLSQDENAVRKLERYDGVLECRCIKESRKRWKGMALKPFLI